MHCCSPGVCDTHNMVVDVFLADDVRHFREFFIVYTWHLHVCPYALFT